MPLINNATTDPDSYILEPGQRLLADSPPEFNPEIEALIRVEPVPEDATEIQYMNISKRVAFDFSRFGLRGPI